MCREDGAFKAPQRIGAFSGSNPMITGLESWGVPDLFVSSSVDGSRGRGRTEEGQQQLQLPSLVYVHKDQQKESLNAVARMKRYDVYPVPDLHLDILDLASPDSSTTTLEATLSLSR